MTPSTTPRSLVAEERVAEERVAEVRTGHRVDRVEPVADPTAAAPPVRIPITRPTLPPLEDYVALLGEIWDSRMLSNFAAFTPRLEELASDYLGARHVLATASGDIGLMIALRALDLPPGSPCFVSTFTFNSTINAALWNGLRPVLVDVDTRTYNMSPASLNEAIARHRGPGVVLPTHVFGNPCDADTLAAMARGAGLYLVFDAAHGYGSRAGDRMVGTLGDAEVFSLSGTKLVTSGEGGLLSTPHDWLAERVRYLRGYGFLNDYVSRYVGINGKLSELHAALGLLTLSQVEDAVAHRAELVAMYRERLGGTVGWQQIRPEDRSTFKDVSLWLGDGRDGAEEALRRAGVQTKRYFRPLHTMPLYQQYADTSLSSAERVYESTLCVPAHADLTHADVHAISEIILKAVASDRT